MKWCLHCGRKTQNDSVNCAVCGSGQFRIVAPQYQHDSVAIFGPISFAVIGFFFGLVFGYLIGAPVFACIVGLCGGLAIGVVYRDKKPAND
jgi:membrane associated rhomboid family serine protease